MVSLRPSAAPSDTCVMLPSKAEPTTSAANSASAAGCDAQALGPHEQRRRRAERKPRAGAALERAERRLDLGDAVVDAFTTPATPLFSPTNEATNGVAG